jgi:hypothetical protein
VDLARDECADSLARKEARRGYRDDARERAVLDDAMTTGYLRELEAAYASRRDRRLSPLFPAGQLPAAGRSAEGSAPARPEKPPSWRAPDVPTEATVERHAQREHSSSGRRSATGSLAAEAKAAHRRSSLGPYGVRRTFVDAGKALKISREGLTALGGWADPQMADRIYADEEQRCTRRGGARCSRTHPPRTFCPNPAKTARTTNKRPTACPRRKRCWMRI